jgi:hypothetical protein
MDGDKTENIPFITPMLLEYRFTPNTKISGVYQYGLPNETIWRFDRYNLKLTLSLLEIETGLELHGMSQYN